MIFYAIFFMEAMNNKKPSAQQRADGFLFLRSILTRKWFSDLGIPVAATLVAERSPFSD